MTTQYKEGAQAEKALCALLQAKGFWAHRMANSAAGQPCDIVALKDGKGFLLDAKAVAHGGRFPLSRIEPNQKSAFAYASLMGVPCGFAIYDCEVGQWRFLSWEVASAYLQTNVASVRLDGLPLLNERIN